MDKVSIIVPDGVVVIDGVGRKVPNLANILPQGVHAVQVTGYTGPPADRTIEVEWCPEPGKATKREKLAKKDISAAVKGWQNEQPPAPPPPPEPDPNAVTLQDKIDALWEKEAHGNTTKMDEVKAKEAAQ